jgi:hypothetical protein
VTIRFPARATPATGEDAFEAGLFQEEEEP